MATWADQNPKNQPKDIPECMWIVRKGQKPDFDRRSNILPWQPALKDDEWEQLRDEKGALMGWPLPPMKIKPKKVPSRFKVASEADKKKAVEEATAKADDEPVEFSVEPAPEPAVEDMATIQLREVFESLGEGDFRPDGVPRLDVMKDKLDNSKLKLAELKEMWAKYQES